MALIKRGDQSLVAAPSLGGVEIYVVVDPGGNLLFENGPLDWSCFLRMWENGDKLEQKAVVNVERSMKIPHRLNRAFFNLVAVAFTVLLLVAVPGYSQETLLKDGNQILVKISGVPAEDMRDFDGEFTISDGGTLALPHLMAEIKATGLTPTALARVIEKAYMAGGIFTNPRITVSQGKVAERFVSVTGEVRTPSRVPFVVGTKLIDVIAAAGGFSDFADVENVKVIRNGKTTVYDLKKITSGGNASIEMQPNDTVVVREKTINPFGFLRRKSAEK